MNRSNISISNEQDLFEINNKKVSKCAQNMIDFALKTLAPEELNQVKDINFGVVFCDNETIHSINSEYRGKDKPTDVITFSLFFDDENKIIIDNQVHLGEIIISTQMTDTQAKENNKTFEEELNFLLSHGILHLLGLDHPDDESLQLMLDLQDKMIKEIL